MTARELWIGRAKFIVGVLAILVSVSFGKELVHIYQTGDARASRLKERQICMVDDFKSGHIFAPTSCSVYDLELQRNPTIDGSGHISTGSVDRDTLVMVAHDWSSPDIIKGESGMRDVDSRIVGVLFISGPLSGRKGEIERYKLSPVEAP